MSDKPVKQQKNKNKPTKEKKKTGFQLKPENINRAGRPKKEEALTDLLKLYLSGTDGSKKERNQILIEKLYKMATTQDDLAAIKYIINRIDGKPVDRKDVELNTDINVIYVDPEDEGL